MKFIDNPFKLTPFILLALCLAVPLYGKGSFPNTWSSLYPTSASLDNANDTGSSCDLCHTVLGTSTWNGYGNAIKRELDGGSSLSDALVAVESANSDGDPPQPPMLPDGWSNIQEITYDGQPGWTTGLQTYYDDNGDSLGTILPPSGLIILDPSITVGAQPTTWGRIKSLYQD